jgi:sporulation protein YlmC with PRC-barrel domain
MKNQISSLTLATLTAVGALCITLPAQAQVAGATTTVNTSTSESTKLAMGWSVKKTLMGATIYNDLDQKVGKVEDLIVSPEKDVSYVIVGAGGFVGIGRHDVAVPISQIQDRAGKFFLGSATKESIKAMPEFAYKR